MVVPADRRRVRDWFTHRNLRCGRCGAECFEVGAKYSAVYSAVPLASRRVRRVWRPCSRLAWQLQWV